MIPWIKNIKPAPYAISSRLFLRLLAVIYLIAFTSLGVQVDGLFGSQGIVPAADLLRAVAGQVGPERYLRFPTLCWLSASDGFLELLCAGGALLSFAAILLPLSALLWFVLWCLYLSLYTVGSGSFLAFQWDILLLEAGFLAIFLAPMTILPAVGRAYQPSRLAVWLIWWLLFRLMFASGVVKITWGDPSWQLHGTRASLTALAYHYETQCIPTWTAWYMHQLPAGLHKATCGAMYFIEIVASCFIFLPRRARLLGCLLQVLLQGAIIATGNYGFFNYLTVALCVPLADDAAWPARFRGRNAAEHPEHAELPRARRWPAWILAPVAALVFTGSLPVFVRGLSPELRGRRALPEPIATLTEALQRFEIVHAYGLFRSMTKERPEIVFEGSDDGQSWKAYELKYKPGDPARRPVFVAPHQPRLDWQMWFAALGPAREAHWLLPFTGRLLEGSRPVLGLLATNPFPGGPPRYLRAMLYDYRFTTLEERRRTGDWWRRELKGPFLRPVSLEDLRKR